ncbi:MAG: photosystem II biosynthesis protein [Prochlorococcaceae cyanobacterium]|jgi:hypothetical protein
MPSGSGPSGGGFRPAPSGAEVPPPLRAGSGIPAEVSSRMVRRIAIAAGIPTALGMASFVVSYLLVTRGVEIPPVATLLVTGLLFLLGLAGLSFGLFSSSWVETPGSLLGLEQIGVNLRRLRSGADAPGTGPR